MTTPPTRRRTHNGDLVHPPVSRSQYIKGPTGIHIDQSEQVWVMSTTLNQISQYSTEGVLQYQFGAYRCTRGGFNGGFSQPHQMNLDSEGNLYVANYFGGYVTKYTPKLDADPRKLVGQPLLIRPSAD